MENNYFGSLKGYIQVLSSRLSITDEVLQSADPWLIKNGDKYVREQLGMGIGRALTREDSPVVLTTWEDYRRWTTEVELKLYVIPDPYEFRLKLDELIKEAYEKGVKDAKARAIGQEIDIDE